MDFKSTIQQNLYKFPGLLEESSVKKINKLLIEINDAGFKKLIQNFCYQKDSDRAYDVLFEIWICKLLLNNSKIKNLEYEPPLERRPPDFRFILDNVCFDVQLKRLQNIANELIQRKFEYECRKRLKCISRPLFINYGLSNHFNKEHINPFFQYFNKNFNLFNVVPSVSQISISPQYFWPNNIEKLVGFTLVEKNKKENNFISIGMIFDDVNGVNVKLVDMKPIKESVMRVLKKSKTTLNKTISAIQSNIVIMKAGPDIWIDQEDMLDILYGQEGVEFYWNEEGDEHQKNIRSGDGLLRSNTFSKICGVIFIPQRVSILDDQIKGAYFPHPEHSESVQIHPKPFPQLPFCFPNTWFSVNPSHKDKQSAP